MTSYSNIRRRDALWRKRIERKTTRRGEISYEHIQRERKRENILCRDAGRGNWITFPTVGLAGWLPTTTSMMMLLID